jgi:hypothetical protein
MYAVEDPKPFVAEGTASAPVKFKRRIVVVSVPATAPISAYCAANLVVVVARVTNTLSPASEPAVAQVPVPVVVAEIDESDTNVQVPSMTCVICVPPCPTLNEVIVVEAIVVVAIVVVESVLMASVLAPVTPSVPITARLPAESNVEVAVEPNEAFVSADSHVVEALLSVVEPVTLSVEENEPVVPVRAAMSVNAPAEENDEVAVPPK